MFQHLGGITTSLLLALLTVSCNRSAEPRVDPGPVAQADPANGVGDPAGASKQTQPNTPTPPETAPKPPDLNPPAKSGTDSPPTSVGGKDGSLFGTWEGTIDGKSITLTFIPKNTALLKVDMENILEGTFVVDWDARPVRLDIDWNKLGATRAVIQLAVDTLKVDNLGPGGDRPKEFSGKAAALKRDRVKDARSAFHRIEYIIGTYWLKHSKLPPSLQALVDDGLMVKEQLVDSWGQPYQYDPIGKRNGDARFLISGGAGMNYRVKRPDIWTVALDKRVIGNWPDDKAPEDPVKPITPTSDKSEKAVAPSKQEVVEYLANRLTLDALLREDRINKLPGLRAPVINALARVPGVGFEERAAWGLLLLSTGSTDLEKAQREYRFARVSIYDKAELADAVAMIGLRKSELALYRKAGHDEPIAEELKVCLRLTAETAPAVAKLAANADVKKLAAVREKLAALFLKSLEDPALLKEITEGEMLLKQATTAEMREAQDKVRKLLAR